METSGNGTGYCQRYDLCAVEWNVGEATNSTRVYWDGLVLCTSYDAPVDWRWLDGQNRIHRVDWSNPDVESWFYGELLPSLGVQSEMPARQVTEVAVAGQSCQESDPAAPVGQPLGGRNAFAALRVRSSPVSGERNLYDFVSGSVVATEIEKTQINMFHTPGGTGFAAEEANALHDRFRGLEVEQVGRTNQLNGADRVVNDVQIQTKYFDSAARTVRAAFDSQGNYRYRDMLLEVPRDQYEECISLMRVRIEAGKVPGVTDPNDAGMVIKKGDVTYLQAKNIAKAGSIDGLVFDAKNQCVTSGYAFAISFCINFAKLKWDGRETDEALADSVSLALQSGIVSFVTGIAVAQVLRTRAAAVGRIQTQHVVEAVQRSKIGEGMVKRVAQTSLGRAVNAQGAANHVAKLLRTSVVTSVVTTVVISTPDFYRAAFRRNISWKQFAKNMAVNGAGVAGGAAGAVAGATAGEALGSLTPIPHADRAGKVVGGVIGGIVGGVGGSAAAKYALDGLIEDDAKTMVRLLPECMEPLATDYMLSETETGELVEFVTGSLDVSFLRDMYQSSSRESFVYNAFEPACEAIIKKRPVVALPEPSEVQSLLTRIQNEAVA